MSFGSDYTTGGSIATQNTCYPNLWAVIESQTYGRLLYFSFGPDYTYFARFERYCLWHISEEAAQCRTLSSILAVNWYSISQLTLGMDGAYVLVKSDGQYYWNLRGRYRDLDQRLSNYQNEDRELQVRKPLNRLVGY